MTTVGTVARKDFNDAARALSLWVATLLLVGVVCLIYLFVWVAQDMPEPRLEYGTVTIMYPIQFLVGLIALLLGFGAIVGERRSGSIKFLLGLPPTRGDVFFGKVVGRFLVLAVAILVTFAGVGILSLVTFGALPVGVGQLLAMTLLLGFVWTSIVVGISALSGSRTRVIAGCLTVWLVFVGLWEVLLAGLAGIVEGGFPDWASSGLQAEPGWIMVLHRLNPVEAFAALSSTVVEPSIPPALFTFGVGSQRSEYTAAERYNGVEGATEMPFYLTDEFGAVVLLAWIVVPLAIGYWRFRSVDL